MYTDQNADRVARVVYVSVNCVTGYALTILGKAVTQQLRR
jgi:hypothetical protein